MKNIYLVQPSNVIGGKVYLPYSVGALAAYALQFPEVRNNYHIGEFVYKKDPIEDVCVKMDAPFLVGFSCYMWNVEYNLALARLIKQKWPSCITAFGGQQVPDNTKYLEEYSFIDILLHGEGEQTFCELLRVYAGLKSLADVSNISYRDNGRLMHTDKKIYRDLSSYPSPYAVGLFDNLVTNGRCEGLDFDAILETNRGCPYGCIYCYWAGTVSNFRLFPMERVKTDILWIAKNQIPFCICGDSNFGILERDNEITDCVVECKKKYGYPKMFETAAAKNKDDMVFEIHKKLNQEHLCCGISIAVQSFSPAVLENIGRKNISFDNYSQQLERYRAEGMGTYTDFILALPGETYDSFCKGIFRALEAGQHDSISIHPCEVVPNTILYSSEVREKYHIKTVKALFQDHALYDPENATYSSRSEVIVSTDTMSEQEWRRAMSLATCVQTFHSFGLLQFIAIYLRKAENIAYDEFYMSFYEWVETKSIFIKSACDKIFVNLDLFLQNRGSLCYYDPKFCDSYLYLREGLFLCCLEKADIFYEEIKAFSRQFFKNDELFLDLLKYQKLKMKHPGDREERFAFAYDWEDYYNHLYDTEYLIPEKKQCFYLAEGCDKNDWKSYVCQDVWYGKREKKMMRRFQKIGAFLT